MPFPPSQPSSPHVHLIDVRSQGEFVLLPVAVYQVVAPLFEPDEFTGKEALALVEPVAGSAGWLDPALDVYDNYDAHRPSSRI